MKLFIGVMLWGVGSVIVGYLHAHHKRALINDLTKKGLTVLLILFLIAATYVLADHYNDYLWRGK